MNHEKPPKEYFPLFPNREYFYDRNLLTKQIAIIMRPFDAYLES